MEHYRTSAHTRFDIKYHFVWITKYRKSVLTGAVGIRLRDLVREICRTNEIEILQGHVSRDHVHILVSAPPNMSASKIMQYIKGKSSRGIETGTQLVVGGTFKPVAAMLGANPRMDVPGGQPQADALGVGRPRPRDAPLLVGSGRGPDSGR